MLDLHNANALLTGASRGIGTHIARALARAGANVALVARTAPALEAVAASLAPLGVRALALPADLDSPAELERLVARATAELGPLDVLVNNAGIENEGAFLSLDAATIERTVRTNVVAPMLLTRLVLPGMRERGRGHVVNIASLAGKKAPPYDAVYGGTKAAVIEWTRALRVELAGSGVSLSAVCPGYVTGEGMFARFGLRPPALVGSCTPEQVAAAVVRAIRRDVPEIIVNSLPMRLTLALAVLFPRASDWTLGALGVTRLQRTKAEMAAAQRSAAP
ncbi:MAG: SDR family NAD(P)-dependent oxidoreductase [Gemmatimonadetes bacterium]|nr:SDR family NAD(P)-dependent oxidoreductase [Gemmatimonadota bacterium]